MIPVQKKTATATSTGDDCLSGSMGFERASTSAVEATGTGCANTTIPYASSGTGGVAAVASAAAAAAAAAPSSTTSTSDNRKRNAFEERALEQLDDAILSIPSEHKIAYTKAMEQVPHLVELESPPLVFLRYDDHDPWAAALRLTEYWNKRAEIFLDRAYRPLILSGDGAMSPEDVELVKAGYLSWLPPDRDGNPVMFEDTYRLKPDCAHFARIRVLFYLLNIVAMDLGTPPPTQPDRATRGSTIPATTASEVPRVRYKKRCFIGLSTYGEKSRSSTFQRHITSAGFKLLKSEVIPIRLVALHVAMMSKKPIMEFIIPATLQLLEHFKLIQTKNDCDDQTEGSTTTSRRDPAPCQVHVHKHKAAHEMLYDLTHKFGFDPEGTPKVPLGGLWTVGSFKRWYDDRILLEKQVYRDILITSGLNQEKGQEGQTPYEVTEGKDARKRRKREKDAAYARLKRARQRMECDAMQEQVDLLRKQQANLQQTNRQLTLLLQHASQSVPHLDQDQVAQIQHQETLPHSNNQPTVRTPRIVPPSLQHSNHQGMLLSQPIKSGINPCVLQDSIWNESLTTRRDSNHVDTAFDVFTSHQKQQESTTAVSSVNCDSMSKQHQQHQQLQQHQTPASLFLSSQLHQDKSVNPKANKFAATSAPLLDIQMQSKLQQEHQQQGSNSDVCNQMMRSTLQQSMACGNFNSPIPPCLPSESGTLFNSNDTVLQEPPATSVERHHQMISVTDYANIQHPSDQQYEMQSQSFPAFASSTSQERFASTTSFVPFPQNFEAAVPATSCKQKSSANGIEAEMPQIQRNTHDFLSGCCMFDSNLAKDTVAFNMSLQQKLKQQPPLALLEYSPQQSMEALPQQSHVCHSGGSMPETGNNMNSFLASLQQQPPGNDRVQCATQQQEASQKESSPVPPSPAATNGTTALDDHTLFQRLLNLFGGAS